MTRDKAFGRTHGMKFEVVIIAVTKLESCDWAGFAWRLSRTGWKYLERFAGEASLLPLRLNGLCVLVRAYFSA